MSIKSLTIYCSSSDKLDKKYFKLTEKIGSFLAEKSIKIIYGGGNSGLMGKLSQSAYNKGGKVIGIIPKFLINKEQINNNTDQTIVVKNMAERKKKLYEMGDSFLILPGGSGTIEELTEIISWKFLGLHNKKIIIFNFKSYWDDLFKIYQNSKDNNFGNKKLQIICEHIRTFQELKKIFS